VSILSLPADLRLSLARRAGRRVELALPAPMPCAGQLVGLPPGRYDWLSLDVSGPGQLDETVWLYYAHGLDTERLAAVDGGPAWVPVPRRDELHAVRLPVRPDLTITGAGLITPAEVRR
jgi:hypothetical protein